MEEIRNQQIIGGKKNRVFEYRHMTKNGQEFFTKNMIPHDVNLKFIEGKSKTKPFQHFKGNGAPPILTAKTSYISYTRNEMLLIGSKSCVL